MPQSIAMLTQMGSGYQPIASGLTPGRNTGLEGIPLVGSGGMAGLAAMAAMPNIYRQLNQAGMVPMGVGHDQNVYDVIRNMQFTQMQMQAMRDAAEADRQNYMRTFRGMAVMTGTPFGAAQRQAANTLSGAVVSAAPILAQVAPELLDSMGGIRGSAAVMAQRMFDAGRYRLDPLTGRMGMSAESTAAMTQQLFRSMYSGGNVGQMQGITAGQLGGMFQELQYRGMISGAPGEAGGDVRTQVRRAIGSMGRSELDNLQRTAERQGVDLGKGIGGLSGADLDKLQLDSGVAERLRSFDSERIKRSLKSYVGAVSAMRDIFGDMGRPNAPMQELLGGLEALTMGSMAQIDPGRLSMIARQTYNLSKQTGVTMDAALAIQQNAGVRAQQLGLEPIFGVTATQGALGFGGAYRAQGNAAHAAWGAMSADQVQQMDANLRVMAAGSHMANRLAVAMRAQDTMGGFAPGSEAANYAQAVKAGLNQYRGADGNVRSVQMGDNEFVRLMTNARDASGRSMGLSENDVRDMLMQRETNREYVDKYGITNIVRRSQGVDELHPFVGYQMQGTLASRFREQLQRQGVGLEEASRRSSAAANLIGQRVTKQMFSMSTEDFANTRTRNANIGQAIGDELAGTEFADILNGLNPEERERFLTQTADRFYGNANRAIGGSAYRAFGNLQNVFRLTNQGTLDESDRQVMTARMRATLQEAMAPLGRGSMLARAVDALQNVKPGEPNAVLKAVAETLGGVRTEDINQSLLKPIQDIAQRQKDLEKLQNDITGASDPEVRADLVSQMEKSQRELRAQANDLAKLGERFGLFADKGVSTEELDRAIESSDALSLSQQDLISARTGIGEDVTQKQIEAVIARSGPAQAHEAAAVLMARRLTQIERLRKEGGTDEALDITIAKLREQQPGASNEQLRATALRLMEANATNFDDPGSRMQLKEMMQNLTLSSPEEARALLRTQRRNLPTRVDVATIQNIQADNPGMSYSEAEALANAQLRAQRLGIDEESIVAGMPEDMREGPGSARARLESINRLFDEQQRRSVQITDEDRTAAMSRLKEITPAMREALLQARPELAGASESALNAAVVDRDILQRRQAESNARFSRFWKSNDGARFRDEATAAQDEVGNIASRLVATPQMTQRLGSRAIEMSETLRESQQRLRDLAMIHTGGDLPQLLAGQLSIDQSTEKGRKTDASVRDEVRSLQSQQREILNELRQQAGAEGRQWQLGDEAKSRQAVVDAAVASGRINRAEAKDYMDSMLNPGQLSQLREAQLRLGGDAAARSIGGLPGRHEASAWQNAKADAIRFGAGSDREIRTAIGAPLSGKLSPEMQAKYDSAKSGVGTREAAIRLLGLGDKTTFTQEEEEKISAVMVGMSSISHAKQLARIHEDDVSEPSLAMARSVLTGRATEEFARQSLGFKEDMMPKVLRDQVQRHREEVANRAEARRLLNLDPTAALPPDKQAAVEELAKKVGVARRMDSEQEVKLEDYANRNTSLESLAKRYGTTAATMRQVFNAEGVYDPRAAAKLGMTAEELSKFNAGFTSLSADEQERLTTARRRYATADRQIAPMERTLERLRKAVADAPAGSDARKQAEKTLDTFEKSLDAIKRDRTAAKTSIEADAIRRGVTPKEYISGKGYLDQARREEISRILKSANEGEKERDRIAAELGISPADMTKAMEVGKLLKTRQEEANRQDTEAPQSLVRKLYSAFGSNLGEGELSPTQKKMAAEIEADPTKRGTAMRMLSTESTLKAFSGKSAVSAAEAELRALQTGGAPAAKIEEARERVRRLKAGGKQAINALADDYFSAMKLDDPKEALTAMQKRYGVDIDERGYLTGQGREQWSKLEKALQFQQQTKLLQLGRDGRGFGAGLLDEGLQRALQGSELTPKPAGESDLRGESKHITGTLKIVGDRGDLVGSWGGSVDHVVGLS